MADFGCIFLICSFALSLGTVSSLRCEYPPGVWCSNAEIAKACQVEKQCKQWMISTNQASPVGVALYYESLCPGCREFIADQLYPTWKKVGADVLNITLVPYGNAQETEKQGMWIFTCQHGERECLGNILETCILHIASDFSQAFETIHCMEASSDPSTAASQCCSKFGIDFSSVSSCANGTLGNKLEHEMGVMTESLDPPHQYTPWITLNGIHTNAIQSRAQSDLLGLVCDTYQGTPPPACSAVPNVCFRNL